jgi:hypothetical protein
MGAEILCRRVPDLPSAARTYKGHRQDWQVQECAFHFAPEGASVEIIDAVTGEAVEPALVDKKTGRLLVSPEFVLAAGPAADEAIRRRNASKEKAAAPLAPTGAETKGGRGKRALSGSKP